MVRWRYIAFTPGLALVLAACGGSADETATRQPPATIADTGAEVDDPTAGDAGPTTTEAAPATIADTGAEVDDPTAEETGPTTTEAAPATSTTLTAAPGLSVPDEYPIPLPPGGDVSDVTEEIENDFGTDQLVTRLDVWYDGDRLEEFALFYTGWILENGNTVLDARTVEALISFSGYLPPDNDTYGVTVGIIGDSTLVQTLWGRPPG